jgi:hypothetical protein
MYLIINLVVLPNVDKSRSIITVNVPLGLELQAKNFQGNAASKGWKSTTQIADENKWI